MTVIVIFMCDRVVQEAEKIVPLTYQLRWCYKNGTREEKQELYEFSNFVTENLPRFSAANFFLLQKSTVLSILSTVSTVIIIMIQFAGK
jgi:gustatory receptor